MNRIYVLSVRKYGNQVQRVGSIKRTGQSIYMAFLNTVAVN